jgi:hypothetical protein
MYKERHGSVTAWLVIFIVVNALRAILNFTGSGIGTIFGGNTGNLTIFGILDIVNIVCFVLIFNWKFIGVIGVVVNSIVITILSMVEMGKVGKAVDSVASAFSGGINYGFSGVYTWAPVFGTVIFLLIFFSVLCKKRDGYSTWDYLLGKETKQQSEYSSPLSAKYPERICGRCGKPIAAGHSSCPNCSWTDPA